jgi:hypothetical protein
MKSDPPALLLSRNGTILMIPFLLQTTNLISGPDSASDYLPIAIQLLFAVPLFLVLGLRISGSQEEYGRKIKKFRKWY